MVLLFYQALGDGANQPIRVCLANPIVCFWLNSVSKIISSTYFYSIWIIFFKLLSAFRNPSPFSPVCDTSKMPGLDRVKPRIASVMRGVDPCNLCLWPWEIVIWSGHFCVVIFLSFFQQHSIYVCLDIYRRIFADIIV